MPDRNVITHAQMVEQGFLNAYDAIAALRSNWLITKGVDSFNSPGRVLVYLDNSRLGGIEELRSLATPSITYIRYYDGTSATARWGLDHSHGVIFVSTHPGGGT